MLKVNDFQKIRTILANKGEPTKPPSEWQENGVTWCVIPTSYSIPGESHRSSWHFYRAHFIPQAEL